MPTPFETFFAGPFQKALDNVGNAVVFSNGLPISRASWDRKAAYLLWRAQSGAVKTAPSEAMEPKTPPQKIPDSVLPETDDAEFGGDDWDIA